MLDVNLLNQIAAKDSGIEIEQPYQQQQFQQPYQPQPYQLDNQNNIQQFQQQYMQNPDLITHPTQTAQITQTTQTTQTTPNINLMPGAVNQLPTYEHKQQAAAQHESKPAQGEWFEGKLISINLGIDGKQKEKCFGLIEIQGKTYSFNSYRNYIIIQTIWLKHLKVNAGGLDVKIQGTFKPKYNDPNTFILFAEDIEITNWSDLRIKAYSKEYPNAEVSKEHTVLKSAKLKLDKPKSASDVVENPF